MAPDQVPSPPPLRLRCSDMVPLRIGSWPVFPTDVFTVLYSIQHTEATVKRLGPSEAAGDCSML